MTNDVQMHAFRLLPYKPLGIPFAIATIVALVTAGCGSVHAAGPHNITLTLVRHAQSAGNRILQAHCRRKQRNQRIGRNPVALNRHHYRNSERRAEQENLRIGCEREIPAAVLSVPAIPTTPGASASSPK